MKKKILLSVLAILILVGSNIGTWFAKDIYLSYYMHPIERAFNKLDYGLRLLVMAVTLKEIKKAEQKRKNSIKI